MIFSELKYTKSKLFDGQLFMNWKKVRLEEICQMSSGGTPSRARPDFYGGNIPWAKISDIESAKSGIITETEEKITEEGLKAINGRIFEKNTLLLAMYGSVGKTAITGKQLSCNQAILGIRLKEANVLSLKFLNFWLQSKKVELLNRAVGGTLQNISLGIVKQLEIPLPDLHTQKYIASILDKADALRQQNRQLLAHYDALLQSTFIDMFGDPVENPKGWEVKRLGDSTQTIQIGPFGSLLHQEDYISDGIPLINPTHINQLKIKPDHELTISKAKYVELKKYHLMEHDIIMGRRGEMGRCALVTSNENGWLCGTGSLFIRPKEFKSALFLVYLLSSKKIKKMFEIVAQGVTMANLNSKVVNDLKIIFPPIHVQDRFAKTIEQIESQKEQVKSALAESEALFQGLLSTYFGDN